MKIAILTQEDGIFSYEFLKPFVEVLCKDKVHELTSINLSRSTASGRKETAAQKTRKIYSTFGLKFLFYLLLRYSYNKVRRKSVSKLAKDYHVSLHALLKGVNSNDFRERLRVENVDLVVIIAGTEIVKSETLRAVNYGFINCHSSVLPSDKGLMPVFWSLMYGRPGFTWYTLDEGIDTGSILLQQKVNIQNSFVEQLIVTKQQAAIRLLEAIEILTGRKKDILIVDQKSSYNKFPTNKDVKDLRKKKRLF